MVERISHIVRRLLAGAAMLVLMSMAPMLAESAGARAYYTSYFPYGQCTWYAVQMRPDLAGNVWGNASNWAYAARASGHATGYNPRAGAVAVFQPGVQGAWGAGHVAFVAAVGADGWFLVREMDFPYAGHVSSRWAHEGGGVTFIY